MHQDGPIHYVYFTDYVHYLHNYFCNKINGLVKDSNSLSHVYNTYFYKAIFLYSTIVKSPPAMQTWF